MAASLAVAVAAAVSGGGGQRFVGANALVVGRAAMLVSVLLVHQAWRVRLLRLRRFHAWVAGIVL